MARKSKRIRECALSTREYPEIRHGILRDGWTPFIVCDSVGAYWNASTIVDKEGSIAGSTSDGRIAQLTKMILEGHFGEEMKDVFVDPDRWDQIYDDLVDIPKPEVIARDSLHLFGAAGPGPPTTSPRIASESQLSELGPTTGPVPRSWSGIVERNATQPSSTYVFRFGERNLWKIGHAVDVVGRLAEVNKHVPHEVLGEQWQLILQHSWPCQMDAYDMEQRVLHALRTASSVGERVMCSQQELESTWTVMLARRDEVS